MSIKNSKVLIFLFVFLFIFSTFNKPTPQVLVAQAKTRCAPIHDREKADSCFREILRSAVGKLGTEKAIEVFSLLRVPGLIDERFDDHQQVHEIGRETAKIKGLTIDAFLSCPSTYNYGCQHGFFEYALSQTSSYKEAAEKICENIGSEKPPKLYSYCYHGVGHGLMMSLAYDLKASIEVCNQFRNQTAIEGCWQGAFMENTNLAVTNEEKVRFISKTDPLYPCNAFPEKYQWQCYINHAGYLMKRTGMSIPKATEICLSAGKNGARPCIQSIGLMVTNSIWQKSMRNVDTILDPKKNVEIAWSMCQEMPKIAQLDCVIGAVGNIHNFDELNTDRSSLFCSIVDEAYKHDCYAQIDTSIAGLVVKEEDDKTLIQKGGPAKVIEKLASSMGSSCHDRAHEIGRMSYEILGADAFRQCSSLCHSGCYHGAAEAFFRDKGTENLQNNLSLICSNGSNRFFSHQCVHGVGHGLMAWASYEIFDALDICDSLKGINNQSSCWTGVFMENIVGGLASSSGHYTKYLNDDPHYPCSRVPDKYKGACYFLQTSRMMQLFNSNFAKIAQTCSEAPKQYQYDCFQSMGRDIGGTTKPDVALAIQKCQSAQLGENRNTCLAGAVQDFFWDKSGESNALTFCKSLKNKNEYERCWQTITTRASEILTKSDFEAFCKNVPGQFKEHCKTQNLAQATQNQQSLGVMSVTNTNPAKVISDNVVIEVTKDGYSPKEVTIKKGVKVIFKNGNDDPRWPASNIHPTHQIYPEFDPKRPIKSGGSWEFVFEKTGIFRYHDHLYPNLTGTITVSP